MSDAVCTSTNGIKTGETAPGEWPRDNSDSALGKVLIVEYCPETYLLLKWTGADAGA